MSIAPSATAQRLAPSVHTGLLIALWLLVAACSGWALVRVLGLDNATGAAVLLISFTPYVTLGAVGVLAAALAMRAWWAAGVAAIAATALLLCVLPRLVTDGGSPTDGPRLRVLSSNMLVGGADAGTIVEIVRREQVDVLAVQEFTPQAARRLDAAGLAALLPYRALYPVPGVEGSGIYSRHPLRDDGLRTQPSGFTQARATVSVPGAPEVSVESAHPCAPSSPAAAACWRADLTAEPPASPTGRVRILVGDFNATLDHAELRKLIATGYRDAADARGTGLSPTWPFDGRQLVPPVTIDHVLADRRVAVTRYAVFGVPGSDHRAVFAELVIPRT